MENITMVNINNNNVHRLMESVPEYALEYALCALMEEKSGEGKVVDGAEECRQRQRHQKSWIPLVKLVVKGVPDIHPPFKGVTTWHCWLLVIR